MILLSPLDISDNTSQGQSQIRLIIASTCCFTTAISATSQCDEPDHVSCENSGTCLIINRSKATWYSAHQQCIDVGARLVVVDTKCVHAIIAMYLTDVDAKSDFFWTSYTNSRWTKSNGKILRSESESLII